MTLAAREPTRHGEFLGRLFNGAVSERPDGISVAFGAHRIDVVTPGAVHGWEGDPGEGALGAGLAIRSAARAGTLTPAAEAGGVAIEWVN